MQGFWSASLILVLTLTLGSIHSIPASAAVRGVDCEFSKRRSLEKTAEKVLKRAGRYLPCSYCKGETPSLEPLELRAASTPAESELANDVEGILRKPELARLLAQGPIRLRFTEKATQPYPVTFLELRVVVVPAQWVARLASSRDVLRFVIGHEIGHLVYESTFNEFQNPAWIPGHLIVDAVGAKLVGFDIAQVSALLLRLATNDVPNDIALRAACLANLR